MGDIPRPRSRGGTMTERPGPLDGVRVVDLTQYVAGPYCTEVLADLGAEVWKVERPGVGDVYRQQGPVFAAGESASFLTMNRGKRSVELDISNRADQERLSKLLEDADVLVENLKPGSLTRHGLDYATLHERFPRLIYCSISGFGQVGPSASLGGYDLTVQALSGLMSMTGHPDAPPAKVPVAALDFGSGLYAVVGILCALRSREQTGEGQWVQASILECALAWLGMHIVTYQLGGKSPTPNGTRSPFFAPYEAYRTQDGYLVIVGTGGADSWGAMCRALGLEHLLGDARFSTNGERVEHAAELKEVIEARLAAQSTAHWTELLESAGVSCAPVQTLPDALEWSQVKALEAISTLRHPSAGDIPVVRLPLHLSDQPTQSSLPPPLLGADNDLLI